MIKRFDLTVAGFGQEDMDKHLNPEGGLVDADVAQVLYDAMDSYLTTLYLLGHDARLTKGERDVHQMFFSKFNAAMASARSVK